MKPRHPNVDWVRKLLAAKSSAGEPPATAPALCEILDKQGLASHAVNDREAVVRNPRVPKS